MKLQTDHIENINLASRLSDEFASLTRVYKGEESVSIQEIKREVIKAIEIMRSKLEVDDTLSNMLSNALALMGKANN